MTRFATFMLIALLSAAPLLAQAPAGWKVRIDRSTTAADPDAAGDVRIVTAGSGFRTTNPQAAVFWHPTNAASGNYTLKGTFTLLKPSGHTNYYGLVFGGSGLDGRAQSYVYFVVAQDGTWLIKRRTGEATEDVAKMSSNAVKRPDASGRSVNALEVRVTANKIDYVVNGTTVHSMPKQGPTAKTDGVYGFRVNHLLEVQVDGLAVEKI